MCGVSVSAAGDVNGDGVDDLIVGAPYGWDGYSYIVFGRVDRTAGAAGYDPSGLQRFVEAISKTPSEKRSLLSKTHPDAADRIEAMDEEIGGIPAADRGTVTAADRFRTRSEGATGPGR